MTRMDYGRLLGDFADDEVYLHPFELTVDGSIVGPYMASFIDATPTWTSTPYAAALGMSARPVPPHLLLNLGLSFSVHDTSQQAIAHLAYVRVDFPKPLPIGGTVRAASKVISTRPSSSGDKGVVHVHTVLVDEFGDRVLDFERKALIRAGQMSDRPSVTGGIATGAQGESWMGTLPTTTFTDSLADWAPPTGMFQPPLWGHFEDFEADAVLVHANGRTVGDTEHMRLSAVCRNSHPLHWDKLYSDANSFAKERVVYGGLVLAWTMTQSSLDVGGQVVWEQRWGDGAHPAPILAGDTIFAASKVLATREISAHLGEVELRVVGIKNARPEALIAEGHDLFTAERAKPRDARLKNKVVEITRTMLVRRR
ncbi:MAG: MaoC family dehydratase [Myxococcales bacterium]|nr:MaoC family dehydratase [Myxococcales bacterium]